jgi:hypothetical protein
MWHATYRSWLMHFNIFIALNFLPLGNLLWIWCYTKLCVVNVVLKIQLKWHVGDDLNEVMIGFKDLCGLPSIHGTIDATHIHL